MALIKDYELDPITNKLMHIDLMEVAMDEKVKVQVAIHLTGNAIGVKEGGILQYGLHQVDIECFPQQIPSHFDVDIAAVKVNDSLHVRDITAPEGVKILNDADATIVTIQPPVSEAKLESMLGTGAPAAAGEGEPELVKKPKKEGEAACRRRCQRQGSCTGQGSCACQGSCTCCEGCTEEINVPSWLHENAPRRDATRRA